MSNSIMTHGVDKHEWTQAAGMAKDAAACVGEMAGNAASAVGAMASRAACEGLGNRLSKTAPHSGVLGSASQAVAGAVKDSGEYLQSAKLGGMTEDVAHLIRKNPIPTILIAIGLGWFLGSKMRS